MMTWLSSIILSTVSLYISNVSVPVSIDLYTSLLHLDEVTVLATRQQVNAISTVSSVKVDGSFLNGQVQSSLAKSLDAIAGVQA